MTTLIEFKNQKGEILRGLLDKANSRIAVICIAGFERTVVEYKFKNIVDRLSNQVNLFRFDFSGCGLSDGKFDDITTDKLIWELGSAISVFKKLCPKIKNIIIVAHSFGACVALKHAAERKNISKIVFFAPAFNQKELQRYWFTVSSNKDKKITWQNFKRYLLCKEFDKEMKKMKRMSKAHYVLNKYFLESKGIDYQNFLSSVNSANLLIVHGDNDDSVPFESNDNLKEFKRLKVIKVKGGDHDLQRMDMVKQYLGHVIDFIKR